MTRTRLFVVAVGLKILEVGSLMNGFFTFKAANEVLKLLGTHLEHNRCGQSERFVRLLCDYLKTIAKGVDAKLA